MQQGLPSQVAALGIPAYTYNEFADVKDEPIMNWLLRS